MPDRDRVAPFPAPREDAGRRCRRWRACINLNKGLVGVASGVCAMRGPGEGQAHPRVVQFYREMHAQGQQMEADKNPLLREDDDG